MEIRTRQELLQLFSQVNARVDKSNHMLVKYQQDFQSLNTSFTQQLRDCEQELTSYLQRLDQENSLRGCIEAVQQQIATMRSSWLSQVESQEKTNVVRDEFNSSLVVFAAGKVKSGKSSLGNYFFYGKTDPDPAFIASLPADQRPKARAFERAKVKNGDASNEVEHTGKFRVGATEATSTIQSFTINGFTWVDSPGLHSLQQENEFLAKKYIDAADLIIYTSNSDQPGRLSDLNEMLKLLNSGKRMIVAITGSDNVEEDVDENDEIVKVLVMKDKQTQLQQQKYLRAELHKQLGELNPNEAIPALIDKLEIISLSSHFAEQHPNDVEAMQQSGLVTLFNHLGQIANSANFTNLKLQAPLTSYLRFLNQIVDEATKYQQAIATSQAQISQSIRELPSAIDTNTRHIQFQFSRILDQDFNQLAALRASGSNTSSSALNSAIQAKQSEWQAKLEQLILEGITGVVEGAVSNISQATSSLNLNLKLDMPAYSVRTFAHKEVAGYSSGSDHSNLSAAAGAAIGAFAGGVGAVVGGVAGKVIGSIFGSKSRIEYETVYEVSGDNFFEVQSRLKDNANKEIQRNIERCAQELLTDMLNSLDQNLAHLNEQCSNFVSSAKNLRSKLKNDLS